MMKNEQSINVWQTSIMLFLMIFANKVLLLPSLLYREANVEGTICYIILFLLEIGLITLFIYLKRKYPETSFHELIKAKLGTITLKVIYILFIIFFVCKLVLIYNITYIFFKDLIYKQDNSVIFLICFLPIINYLSFINFRAFGRTCQLFFPIILIIALFCVLLSFISVDSVPLLYQSNLSGIIITTLKHISSFGDVIFLFIFMDKIDYKKGDGKKLFSLVILAIILVVGVSVAFYYSYTYTSFMHPYAIFEILGNIKNYGGLGRIDVIAVIFVMFLTYFQMAIYLKSYTKCFNVVFTKLNSIYALVSFDIGFILIVELLIRNLEKTIAYGESVLPYLSLISFFIVPICSIIFLIIKKKQNNKEKEWCKPKILNII